MKWINDVVFAILAAHVWGSLMLFVWLQAVKRLENKGYTRLLFYLLRAVIVAYLLPLGLGAVLIINEILVLDGRFMQTTPVISMIDVLLFVIWILGFFANFESLQEKWDMTRHCFSDALPASRERQLRFQEICRQTKMRSGRVILCEKAGIRCGGITVGVIHPKIVLPEGETDEFVERVTMIHELVHYTRKDIWFLTAAKVVEAIHWFNPWTRGLAAQMSQWNEYACDWEVCNKYLGNIKAYLEVLYRVSMQGQDDKADMYSSIGTQPMKLIGRMEKMINMKNAMKRPKFFGVLAAVAVSFTSAGSALASTGILAGGYRALYELTDVEKDQSDIELAASANFDWSLPSDFMRTTKDFWETSSHHITVGGTITPTGKILRVGIIEPSGIRRCIYATGNFSYNFPLDKTGFYCVYAINDNSEVVNLSGTYSTY